MKLLTVAQINKQLATAKAVTVVAHATCVNAWLNAIIHGNTQQFDVMTDMVQFTNKDERSTLQPLFKNLPIKKDKETKKYEGVSISGKLPKYIMRDLKELLSGVLGVEYSADMTNVIAYFKAANDATPSSLLKALTEAMIADGGYDVPVAPDGKAKPIKSFDSLIKGVTIGKKEVTIDHVEDGETESASVVAKLAMGMVDNKYLSDATKARIQKQFLVGLQMLQDAHVEIEHTKAGIAKAA